MSSQCHYFLISEYKVKAIPIIVQGLSSLECKRDYKLFLSFSCMYIMCGDSVLCYPLVSSYLPEPLIKYLLKNELENCLENTELK